MRDENINPWKSKKRMYRETKHGFFCFQVKRIEMGSSDDPGLLQVRLGRMERFMNEWRGSRDACGPADGRCGDGKPGAAARAIRLTGGLTQQAFARTYGFTLGAVRDWEQGRKRPDRSARIVLELIRTMPDAVAAAVASLRGSE
jgi:hypothetical protein